MTCAACHTKEIRLGDTGYRIDGAPTQGDVQGFLAALTDALQKTRRDPQKFARFAAKILGPVNDAANQADLAEQLTTMINTRIRLRAQKGKHHATGQQGDREYQAGHHRLRGRTNRLIDGAKVPAQQCALDATAQESVAADVQPRSRLPCHPADDMHRSRRAPTTIHSPSAKNRGYDRKPENQ